MLSVPRNLVAISPKYEDDRYATDSGILLYKHDSYKGRTVQGIVKYIGPKCEEVKPGDYVFYTAYDGSLWSWKGELVIIMPETQILCKAENIPYTGVSGIYMREKIDTNKNKAELFRLLASWDKEDNPDINIYEGAKIFIDYLSDKVDAYGAYFEAPYEKVIELIADTFKREEWTNTVQVGKDRVNPVNADLYKNEKFVCDYCGGKLKQIRERSTTFIFYRCEQCGRVKDRKMVKSEV